MIQRLCILGCGYVGQAFAKHCLRYGLQVVAVVRHIEAVKALRDMGIEAYCFDTIEAVPVSLWGRCDALLDSIPLARETSTMYAPQTHFLAHIAPFIQHMHWCAYLSSSSVYGDAKGAWVDESSLCQPSSERGRLRLQAEQAWLTTIAAAEVFRLTGIYGPGRCLADRLLQGDYKVVRWLPEHWSNRVHLADIVASLWAAMQAPKAGRVLNVSDDEPLPHVDYVSVWADFLQAAKPMVLSETQGEAQLSPAMMSFFRDNKRVSNQKLHDELLAVLHYPSFRDAMPELRP